jgi:uncharacterized protein
LLDGGQISALHRLKSADEIWHFYAGSSLTIYIIEEERTRKLGEFRLGNNIEGGDIFQLVVIRRGSWFGAIVNDPSSYSLVGCTVSPAFDFEDFELGQRENLVHSKKKKLADYNQFSVPSIFSKHILFVNITLFPYLFE